MDRNDLKLLDDIYYLHPMHGWKKAYLVSKEVKKKGKIHYLVSGYGQPLYFKAVLPANELTWKQSHGELEEYTTKLMKEVETLGLQ